MYRQAADNNVNDVEQSAVRGKRNYIVTDEDALRADFPQFFRYSVDHSKIKKAIALGIFLPGVSINGDANG